MAYLRIVLATLLAIIALPAAAQELRIDSAHGTIDFAVGDSVFFRTAGVFKRWQGSMRIDENNIPGSTVKVTIDADSVETRDAAQNEQLRGPDFFDVQKFPTFSFSSTQVVRTGPHTLRVTGNVILRGVTRPMVLDVDVQQQRQGEVVSARFVARGRIDRTAFGMTKFTDMTGNNVDLTIRAEAVR